MSRNPNEHYSREDKEAMADELLDREEEGDYVGIGRNGPTPRPATSAESMCPTCGSNDRKFYRLRCASVEFETDPWHSAESGKEGETNVANTDVRGRSEFGRSSADLLANGTTEPLTAPAQGAARYLGHSGTVPIFSSSPVAQKTPHLVNEAREAIKCRWKKYSDPANEEWDFESIDKWERHAINAVLDLEDAAHVAAQQSAEIGRLREQMECAKTPLMADVLAEIGRLRQALDICDRAIFGDENAPTLDEAKRVARAALASGKEKPSEQS